MRIIAWIIAAVTAVAVIAFAVANRDPMAISVAPLPYTLLIPAWTLAVGALAVGFVAGAAIRWLLDRKPRRLARQRTRMLERELARLRDRLDEAMPAGGDPTSRKDAV